MIHIFYFLAVTLGLHFIFLKLEWPGANGILAFTPLLFGIFHLIKSGFYLIKNEKLQVIISLGISLLFCLLTLKLHYEFYNIFLSVILILLTVYFYIKKRRLFNPDYKFIYSFVLFINVFLTFIPDIFILKYYYSEKDLRDWNRKIDWSYFKSQPNLYSKENSQLVCGFIHETNKALNYPPAIVYTFATPDSSWKKSNLTSQQDSVLLEKMQIEFDILELNCRRANDKIKKSWGKKSHEVNKIIAFFINQNQYLRPERDKSNFDSFLSDDELQIEWRRRIDVELNK